MSSDADITTRVFEEFIKKLETEPKVDAAVVARLREALLEKGDFSVDALTTAFFSTDDAL